MNYCCWLFGKRNKEWFNCDLLIIVLRCNSEFNMKNKNRTTILRTTWFNLIHDITLFTVSMTEMWDSTSIKSVELLNFAIETPEWSCVRLQYNEFQVAYKARITACGSQNIIRTRKRTIHIKPIISLGLCSILSVQRWKALIPQIINSYKFPWEKPTMCYVIIYCPLSNCSSSWNKNRSQHSMQESLKTSLTCFSFTMQIKH